MGKAAELLKSKKTIGILFGSLSVVIVMSFVLSFPLNYYESDYENSKIKNLNDSMYYVTSILLSVKDPNIIVESEGAKLTVLVLGFLSILFIALITTTLILIIQRTVISIFASDAVDKALDKFEKKK